MKKGMNILGTALTFKPLFFFFVRNGNKISSNPGSFAWLL